MPPDRIPIDLSDAPYDTDYEFSKERYYLGEEFSESKIGYLNGAIKQYRGPNCQHVKEYEDHYLGHRDRVDPRVDPIGHLVKDAPEALYAIFAGTILSILAFFLLDLWRRNRDLTDRRIRRRFIILIVVSILIVIVVTIGILYLGKYLRECRRERIVVT